MAASETAYLLLDVAGVPCALARATVRAVLPLPHLHAPPEAGGPLAGLLNLGGAPVPVIDLARLLGLRAQGAPEPDDPYRHLLLAADGGLALLVDRVEDLLRVEADAVRPVREERTLAGCVEAEIALGDRLVHVLSPERLLGAEERARLADHARRAAERLTALGAAA